MCGTDYLVHVWCLLSYASLSFLFLFFFLMIRRPPRSTLFPYRRSSDLDMVQVRVRDQRVLDRELLGNRQRARHGARVDQRSEEHTSELQSQSNLVCRLLLEKKKKKKKDEIKYNDKNQHKHYVYC